MAADIKESVQKLQRHDGLPKAASVDAWLDAHRKKSTDPMLGSICWYHDTLTVVARIKGRIHALPFSRFTPGNRFRDALTKSDRAFYDKWHAEALAGAFNHWVEKKRNELAADGFGFSQFTWLRKCWSGQQHSE